jgi:hypothetical protein
MECVTYEQGSGLRVQTKRMGRNFYVLSALVRFWFPIKRNIPVCQICKDSIVDGVRRPSEENDANSLRAPMNEGER